MTLIQNYLDADGCVKIWPSKRKNKVYILKYIAAGMEKDVQYTEKELDAHIQKMIVFDDYVIVRRELFENKFVNRTLDGKLYWRVK